MYYVYLLQSLSFPDKTYIGFTTNIKERLQKHNEGGSIYTADYRPWRLVSFVGFDRESKAIAFEKYIKSGSGYAFAKRRLW
jgi:predicted GIY-YIG superfamily endonuclease